MAGGLPEAALCLVLSLVNWSDLIRWPAENLDVSHLRAGRGSVESCVRSLQLSSPLKEILPPKRSRGGNATAMPRPNDGLVGLASVEPQKLAGIMPNAQHQTFHGFMTGAPYQLAIVEFDDQGAVLTPTWGQMDAVAERLDFAGAGGSAGAGAGRHPGRVRAWMEARRPLGRRQSVGLPGALEGDCAARAGDRLARRKSSTSLGSFCRLARSLGIRIGRRHRRRDLLGPAGGRAASGDGIAARAVRAAPSLPQSPAKAGGNPLLVIAGHSFGGMIVFSALAQSLIEAASAPAGKMAPQFADLVLLVNPAIEGSRYLPIQDLVSSPAFKNRAIRQLPVFLCAQAENDQPVGTWFPVGNIGHRLDEATIGDLEKECVTRAIGFVATFRTHTLAGPQAGDPFVLTPPGSAQVDPFWVVGATKEVIDGHGGIWGAPFLLFIASLLFQHVQASRAAAGGGGRGAEGRGDKRTSGRSGDLCAIHRPDQTSAALIAGQRRKLLDRTAREVQQPDHDVDRPAGLAPLIEGITGAMRAAAILHRIVLVVCNKACYIPTVIESFSHKGLKRLFEDDDRKLLRQDLVERIAVLLGYLENAKAIEELDIPSLSAFCPSLSQRPLCFPWFFLTQRPPSFSRRTRRVIPERRPQRLLVDNRTRQLADYFSLRGRHAKDVELIDYH